MYQEKEKKCSTKLFCSSENCSKPIKKKKRQKSMKLLNKRLKAGWDKTYLMKILNIKVWVSPAIFS